MRSLLLAGLLAIAVVAPIASPALSAPSDEALLALRDRASRNGTVRVLVTLRTKPLIEAHASPALIARNRQAVAALRDEVLQRVMQASSLRQDQIRRTYRVSPVVALEAAVDVLDALQLDPAVERVQEDRLLRSSLSDSTQLIGSNSGWPAFIGGNGQAVAVLDTGVDSTHPSLVDRVVSEACFSSSGNGTNFTATSLCPGEAPNSTAPGSGLDCEAAQWGNGCGHGTHVAGIAAASGANAPLLEGVAPQASIIAIQVFSGITDTSAGTSVCGGRPTCTVAFDSDIIAGLEHVFLLRDTLNIAAANLSLGGGMFSAVCDAEPMKFIIDQLREARIATVVASGNAGSDTQTSFPACISTAVTVGSTTKFDMLSSFSNVAPWVDLLAPGDNICSTIPTGNPEACGGDTSAVKSGTSMAAPHVAGAFAHLRALSPLASVAELESYLQATGVPVATFVGDLPRIQLDEAFAAAQNGVSRPPLINVSTRGFVGTGDDVLIGGFIVGDSGSTVIVRARGPSLADFGVPGTLQDPQLTVFDGPTPIASNDNWQTDAASSLMIEAAMAPNRASEAAVMLNLSPGPYTVIVSGVGGGTGVGIVEVFELSYVTPPAP